MIIIFFFKCQCTILQTVLNFYDINFVEENLSQNFDLQLITNFIIEKKKICWYQTHLKEKVKRWESVKFFKIPFFYPLIFNEPECSFFCSKIKFCSSFQLQELMDREEKTARAVKVNLNPKRFCQFFFGKKNWDNYCVNFRDSFKFPSKTFDLP